MGRRTGRKGSNFFGRQRTGRIVSEATGGSPARLCVDIVDDPSRPAAAAFIRASPPGQGPQQPPDRTSPKPKDVSRPPGPRSLIPRFRRRRAESADNPLRAAWRASNAVTMGAAKEVPV